MAAYAVPLGVPHAFLYFLAKVAHLFLSSSHSSFFYHTLKIKNFKMWRPNWKPENSVHGPGQNPEIKPKTVPTNCCTYFVFSNFFKHVAIPAAFLPPACPLPYVPYFVSSTQCFHGVPCTLSGTRGELLRIRCIYMYCIPFYSPFFLHLCCTLYESHSCLYVVLGKTQKYSPIPYSLTVAHILYLPTFSNTATPIVAPHSLHMYVLCSITLTLTLTLWVLWSFPE